MKKVNKILCAGFASLICLFGFTGCGNEKEGTKVISCVPDEKESKGMWYEFVLAEDGKTVTQFVEHIGIDRDFLANNVTFEDGSQLETQEDLEYAWDTYGTYYSRMMDAYLQEYGDKSWLYFDMDSSEEDLTLELSWGVDLTDETLNLEDETVRTMINGLLTTTSDVFYNKEENCYQVDTKLLEENMDTQGMYKYVCSNKIVENVDDLEFTKLVKKVSNKN